MTAKILTRRKGASGEAGEEWEDGGR